MPSHGARWASAALIGRVLRAVRGARGWPFHSLGPTNKNMRFDWKFTLSLIVALGGVLIPIWIWQFDWKSNSMSVRLASSVDLRPATHNSIGDLRLVVGENEINSPFLSTVELVNDGSRPIPAASFEGQLNVLIDNDAKLVRVTVEKTNPTDLQPHVVMDDKSLKLSPLLLNPADSITFSILSAGVKPKFSVRSRIAGINKINFEDATVKTSPLRIYALNLPIVLLGVLVYSVFAVEFVLPGHFGISRPLAFAVMLSSAVGSSSILRRSFEMLGIDSEGGYSLVLPIVAACFSSIIVLILFRRRRRRSLVSQEIHPQ